MQEKDGRNSLLVTALYMEHLGVFHMRHVLSWDLQPVDRNYH